MIVNILEDKDNNTVDIDGKKVEGFVLDEVCDTCGSKKVYYEKYDANFCPQENKWIDNNCLDPQCDYCKNRPEKPL